MASPPRIRRILRMPETSHKASLGPSTIYDLVARGIFPKPIKLVPGGRAVGWFEDQIDEYLQQRASDEGYKHQASEQSLAKPAAPISNHKELP
jgi:prophage regulatory protein